MDDRTQPRRDNAPSNRSAPDALNPNDDSHRDGRSATRDERRTSNQSSSAKPGLTERERRERWPVD
jgi:hypothetical protein